MTDRELLQQALDALKHLCLHSAATRGYDGEQVQTAIDALKARLAQPEPEETIAKWIKANTEHRQWYICPKCSYQAPRFRDEWVGLTDNEIYEAVENSNSVLVRDMARAIETKLKEKNNG